MAINIAGQNSLALCSIANVSGLELCQALYGDVRDVLLADDTTSYVKKKAALCLLRLIRTLPDVFRANEFSYPPGCRSSSSSFCSSTPAW